MIVLHRLRGEQFLVNADLIESVETTPDTVITLVDGRKLVVSDAASDIAQRTIEFRAAVLAAANRMVTDAANVSHVEFGSSQK